MSLNDDLKQLAARSMTDARVRRAYESLVEQLGRADTVGRALKTGDRMPGFVLPNAEGRLVMSDELLARGPLVLVFFRGNWCPFCVQTLAALKSALPRIAEAGGQLVALTPETGRHLADTKRRQKLNYEILSDVDGAVGMQFGVLFRLPQISREMLAEFGVDLAERHGNESWLVPLPATYVVDRGGVIRYAFVDVDFTKRAEPDEIIAVLGGLKDR